MPYINKNLKVLPDVVGIDESKAIQSLEGAGYITRVTSKDGKNFMCTCDYRKDRVNLTIVNGIIQGVKIG